jgi:heparan-alpha-glucosaminide N-acetyltransferase
MMLGLWCGVWLQSSHIIVDKLKGLVLGGVALTIGGLLFQWLHVCPVVKRIWTSSYTLYSGGLVVLMLAGFYAVIELRGWRKWSFPLLVIGANSIVVYVMSWTMEAFVSEALARHVGSGVFRFLGAPFEPVLRGAGVLLLFWVILLWLYRKKIFVRI